MNKRMIQMLAVVTVVVAILGFIKFQQIQAAIAGGRSFQPPPEPVTTVVARVQKWPASLEAIGSVEPVQGVTLSADLAGVVDRIAFESGASVRAGQVLVTLDTRQEKAQLASAEAQRDLARTNFERARTLLEQKAIAQADFDAVASQFKQADAQVHETEATIDRKTIRAPFAGVTGIRLVNLGQYLQSGTPVVPLQAVDPVYVDFSVPQQQAAALRVGAMVSASADSGAAGLHTGRLTTINPIVDEATRNVRIQATFRNARRQLRVGSYVSVKVALGELPPAVALPASAINFAPYGNSVFIVEKMKGPNGQLYQGVRQQFVKLGPAQGDQVAILSGVRSGDEVVTSGVFKLRPGAAVMVNNKVQPSNSLTPKPEDS